MIQRIVLLAFLLSSLFLVAQEAHSIEFGLNYGTGYTSFNGDISDQPIGNYHLECYIRAPLISREDRQSRVFWITSVRLHGADLRDVIYQFGTSYELYETRGRWRGYNALSGLGVTFVQREKVSLEMYAALGLSSLYLPEMSVQSTGDQQPSYMTERVLESDPSLAIGGAFGLILAYDITKRFGIRLGADVTSFNHHFRNGRGYEFDYDEGWNSLRVNFDFKEIDAHYFAVRGVLGTYYRF